MLVPHEYLLSAVVTVKTPVHQPVVQIYYDTCYEHLHIYQEVFAGVHMAAARTSVARGFALGFLLRWFVLSSIRKTYPMAKMMLYKCF